MICSELLSHSHDPRRLERPLQKREGNALGNMRVTVLIEAHVRGRYARPNNKKKDIVSHHRSCRLPERLLGISWPTSEPILEPHHEDYRNQKKHRLK